MNLHNMEHLSLDEGSRRQQPNDSLPSIGTFYATAERGEDLRVGRPHDYQSPPSAHALQYGQPPQHGAGHAQVFTPYHYSHGQPNISVESVPSTAYSSPRMMPSNNHFDTSSVSSSSRESSVYSGTPSSSANTVRAGAASNSRSTRAKRGSESQVSGSGRARKRPSMSQSGSQSGDEFVRWCDTCDSLFRDCSTPKEHERKSRKIVKEKAARSEMAGVLQQAEDLLENVFNLNPLKKQMPGNQKKSGLTYDKQQDIETILLVLNILTRELALVQGPEAFEEFSGRTNKVIERLVTANDGELPVECSLLAAASGEDPCPHERRGLHCDTPIVCRKARHNRNYTNNMARIFEPGTTTTTPAAAAAAATLPVRPASTPRRRNHSNL